MMIYIFIMNPSSSLGDISLAYVLEGNIGHACKYKMSQSQPCANCLVSWKIFHSPPDHTSESTSTPPDPQGLQPVSSTQKQCLYSPVLPSCDSYNYWTENDELGKLCFASFSEPGKWWQEIHLTVCANVYTERGWRSPVWCEHMLPCENGRPRARFWVSCVTQFSACDG